MNIKQYVTENYDAAVQCYASKRKTPLLKTLQRGPNTYNIEKLAYELEKLGFEVPATPDSPAVTISTEEASQQLLAMKEKFEELNQQLKKEPDEVLKAMHRERVELWKEASHLHTMLSDNPDKVDENFMVSSRILMITNSIIPAIDRREAYYKEHGALPNDLQTLPKGQYDSLTGHALFTRVATLKKNISRDKIKKPEKVPAWEKELAFRQIELSHESAGK